MRGAPRIISIARWREMQHYKDRNPPWVKLHAELLDRTDFRSLTSCDFGAYCRLLLIASRRDNRIDHDSRWLRRYGVSATAIRHLHAAGLITVSESLSESLGESLSDPLSTLSESDRAPIGVGSESHLSPIGVPSGTDRNATEHAPDLQRPSDQAHDSKSASTSLAACMQSAPSENREQRTEDREEHTQSARTHERSQSVNRLTDAEHHQRFERCKGKYPAFAGKQDWIYAERAARKLVSDGVATWDQLEAACARHSAYCDAVRTTGTQFVMRPGKFFTDENRPWAQEWTPPAPEQPAGEDRNARELQKFLAGGQQ